MAPMSVQEVEEREFGQVVMWDADACCPYFQTGACAHTENGDEYWEGME